MLEATLSKLNCPPKSAPALLTGMLGFHVIAGYDSLQLLPATSSLMHIEVLPSMTSKKSGQVRLFKSCGACSLFYMSFRSKLGFCRQVFTPSCRANDCKAEEAGTPRIRFLELKRQSSLSLCFGTNRRRFPEETRLRKVLPRKVVLCMIWAYRNLHVLPQPELRL